MGKLLPSLCIPVKRKIKIVFTRFGLSLYNAQIGKNTKILSIPIIHEGQNGKKNHKREVKRGSKGQKIKKHFRTVRKFRILLRNSRFSSFFCSSFLLVFLSTMLSSTRILCAWIDSTSLALITCKNYKISHKMRLVE